jgi:hypothetical protein
MPGWCGEEHGNPVNLRKPIVSVAVGLAIGGCATAPKPDSQFLARPHEVSLAQIYPQDRDAIRSVVAPDLPKDSLDADEQTGKAIEAAQSQALTDLNSVLATIPDFKVDSAPVALPSALKGFPITDRNQPLTPDVLAALRDSSRADVLLRFGISDYGLTPKAWRDSVIAFEVVSTLGIAAIAYAKPATRAIAGVYLAQETIEETLEAYSGFKALDEVYRPVRVEAEMIDLQTGRRVWADSETGFSDRRLSRIYKTVTNEERKAQLSTALHGAIVKIVNNFRKSAGR